MNSCLSRSLLTFALLTVHAAYAFLPPSDKQEGVTLRIEGFKEASTPERFAAAKVPADKPLVFTVTLVNDRTEPVAGTVKVWLNDDWQVTDPDTAPLAAAPGGSASATFTATAKPSVLNALYPVHARLALAPGGRTFDLHPIAIFEAVKPKSAPSAAEQKESALAEGVLQLGDLPALATEKEWTDLEAAAIAAARGALAKKPKRGSGAFRLDVRGERFGAAVAPGRQGLTDAAIAFSDGVCDLVYRGFTVDIDCAPVGGVENGQPVLKVDAETSWGGVWTLTHRVATPGGAVAARAKVWAEEGALRVAWDMPGAVRDARGTPRYTRLGIGSANLPVWRAYAGFGNVIEDPGPFNLTGGGFNLSTRHVGADHTNGLSLVQACDIFPDCLAHAPETRRFALETRHDAAFFFIPSARGAFAAARAYRDLCGFEKGPGLKTLGGRMCIDQWGWSGDYREVAEGLREAARYGVTDAVFVKHVWQRWGYDYRLPEIYPPAGDLDAFLEMRKACDENGILFCPHDNYIDFYPDAEGYSYDHIIFNEDGTPQKGWYHKRRTALSYRWAPHAFRPWLEANMRLLRDHVAPDSLFIDVFTARPPLDYYDRTGTFYPRTRTQKEWRDAFDTCRRILKRGAPMISEAGNDALIGSLDAGQSDHFPASRWMKTFGDADRTPWHDMATHGRMVLFAGGLGPRYAQTRWDRPADNTNHGYGSDDYLSNTVLGGRNPMCDGPFNRRTVMTYWLLHDVCEALAKETFETHQFGDSVYQQHTTFSGNGRVWANRATNSVWALPVPRTASSAEQGGAILLPAYGFYASTPSASAGVFLFDGQRAGFAKSKDTFFADARPVHNPLKKMAVESATASGAYRGGGVFEATFNWNVLDPAALDGYVPFLHISSERHKDRGAKIAFQEAMKIPAGAFKRPGPFTAAARIAIPKDLPAGDHLVRYGLYRPGGARMAIRGSTDGEQRVMGGVMTVGKRGDAFTSGSFTLETHPDDVEKDLNVAKKMLDFGPLVTDGAFRLLHGNKGAWTLIPLPGSNPFKAEIDLAAFGAARAKVKAVEKTAPFHASAADATWTQEGAALRLACDGQSFAYRIVFE